MDYDLELDKVVEEVKKLDKNRVKVCLQFPDGLKANATEAVKELEKKTAGKAIFFMPNPTTRIQLTDFTSFFIFK